MSFLSDFVGMFRVRPDAVSDPYTTYLQERRRLAEAPFDLAMYRSLLKQAKTDHGVALRPYVDRTKLTTLPSLYVRHDIDRRACVDNIQPTLDIDVDLGVRSGVYIRVDDDEYGAGELRDVAQAYRARALEFGLHTVCYLKDDWKSAFARETEKFADEIGFRPTSFTVHGLGAHRYAERAAFQGYIINHLDAFGYRLTDCEMSSNQYTYVIQDCHWDDGEKQRFVYEDFDTLPPILAPGRQYLVLTHPCYWPLRKIGA